MESFLQDVRYAARTLRRSPGFTLAAVTTLALGVGSISAIFSVLDSVLLRPIPYPEPERIVYVWELREGRDQATASAPDFVDWHAQARSFSSLAARTGTIFSYTGSSEPERLRGGLVSADYFAALGLNAVHGRLLNAGDDRFQGPKVVVLGAGFWSRRFGSDSSIVGKSILLNGEPYSVVGILQPHIRLTDDVFAPLALSPANLQATGTRAYTVLGRLREGVTPAQAQAEMEGIASRIATVRPGSNAGYSVRIVPVRDQILGNGSRTVFILFGAFAFVLLIACANVANLLLARAITRRKELGVRAALGAGRGRILRQLLVESSLLAALGGIVGFTAAFWGLRLLVGILPPDLPRLIEISMRADVAWFTLAVTGLVAIGFGLVPAFSLFRGDTQESLQGETRGTTGARGRLRALLVVSELALAVMLLAGAGLLIRSFREQLAVAWGVDADRVLSLQLSLPARYAEPEQIKAFYAGALERVRALPGVQTAAVTANVPLTGSGPTISLIVEGRPVPEPRHRAITLPQLVTPDYFGVLGVQVKNGRGLTDADRAGAPRVAVVNETMARQLWPDGDAIGARLTMDDGETQAAEIVGIVADVRHYGPGEPARPELYMPMVQAATPWWRWTRGAFGLVVRARDEPAALTRSVQQAVWSLDRDVPLFNVRVLTDVIAGQVAPARGLMLLLSLLAALALALSAVGAYGVIAFSVSQRTREMGIRMTLGAQTRDVVRLVLGQGFGLIGAGAGLGLVGAIGLTRVLRNALFEVSPTDPAALLAGTLLLIGVATLACYIPARRASRSDPVVALRSE